MNRISYILTTGLILIFMGCGPKWTETEEDGIHLVKNKGGSTLGYSEESGVQLLAVRRFAFKDLNKNGELDPYEDWRKEVDERAADLASKMSIEQIAGLMLYSAHQRIPGGGFGRGSTYNGKPYDESGAQPSDLSDNQVDFLTNDNLRHVLITSVESPEVAASWNNNAQALVEGLGLGIPINNSSDPRHQAPSDEEYTLGAGGDISRWPNSLGMAATFDPELVRRFGEVASIEYRALGLTTALSPQVDLATDPRWYRFSGTFGPSPDLSRDMARAYVDGFQTSSPGKEINNGWGFESVNAMVKHWPGGGSGEGGRDAHYGFGKYAVYPGDNFSTQLIPFIDGAFKLEGGTGMASAVMPYYTISFNQDPSGENVGNAYNKYIITDLLRKKYGFEGVVCTDWGVTRDEDGVASFGRTPHGVEHLTEAQKHYKVLMAGCDQFGGNNDSGPVIEAYEMGVEEHGEEFMRKRFEQSAIRLLRNIFRLGLFENPYLDVDEIKGIVGNPDFMKEGYEAQRRSVVMLKNRGNILPLKKETSVYIPQRFVPASRSFFGQMVPGKWVDPVNMEIAGKYLNITTKPEDAEEADVAIIVVNSPNNGRTAGYSTELAEKGESGYIPISLQYAPYTSIEGRDPSIAGDPREGDVLNRTFRNKKAEVGNASDLKLIRDTRTLMKEKPVIVILRLSNPTVVGEFEKEVDAMIVNFGVQDQVILEILMGETEPSGLLPLQMPADMSTVELQYEDVPFDMTVHIDSEGNAYDFGFGLNWSGLIQDGRVSKYSAK